MLRPFSQGFNNHNDDHEAPDLNSKWIKALFQTSSLLFHYILAIFFLELNSKERT